jgi:hypothetical protein
MRYQSESLLPPFTRSIGSNAEMFPFLVFVSVAEKNAEFFSHMLARAATQRVEREQKGVERDH